MPNQIFTVKSEASIKLTYAIRDNSIHKFVILNNRNIMRMYLLVLVMFLKAANSFSQNDQVNTLLSLTGQPITTITHKTITNYYGRTLAQLLNDQPGIVINGAYQPNGSLVSIYMEGTLGGRALILLDGIPVYDPSSLPDYFDLNFISVYDIEQIDIYHEAQSSTMGNGAFAGTINIITQKKDGNKPLQLHTLQSIGNKGTSNSNLGILGNEKKWSYAASYTRVSTNGFPLAHDSIGNQGFKNDGLKSNIFNSRLQYTFNPSFRINTHFLYSQYKADSDDDVYVNSKDYFYNDKLLHTGAGFSYSKKNMLLECNYQFDQTNRYYHYDNEYHETYIGHSQFAELYLQSRIASHLKFLLGADYRNNYMNSRYYDTTAATLYYFPSVNLYSVYSKLCYVNTDSSLSIDLAGRETHHVAFGFVGGYNLSGNYRIYKHVDLFGGIATGFKSPCQYQLYNSDGINNPNLLPEKTVDYYIGILAKQKQFTQKLRLFYNHLTDLIYFDRSAGEYDNFNKQKTWGLQYELEWKLNKAFRLTINYTLTKGADYSIGHANYMDTITYPYLYRRPEHVINVGIHYTHKVFNMGITARYVSDYYDVDYALLHDPLISHFLVVNAYSDYNINQNFKLFINIQNLLNNTFYDVPGLNSIPLLINGGVNIQL